jgi:hypothetical protein
MRPTNREGGERAVAKLKRMKARRAVAKLKRVVPWCGGCEIVETWVSLFL